MLRGIWRTILVWLGLIPKPQYLSKLIPRNPPSDDVRPGLVLVVGGPDYQKWAFLRCPCGCGEVIMLSLAQDRQPRWTVTIDKYERPTVYPSIRRLDGCYSHFWLRNGEVTWCPTLVSVGTTT
jgi:hypothetical protein